MSRPKSNRAPVKQILADDIIIRLERFIRTKWYRENSVGFTKDRPELHKWVILKLACQLEDQGVTLPPERYLQIMEAILMDALRHGAADIKYVPAWLGKTIETHLRIHGEKYYEEGKAHRDRIAPRVDSIVANLPKTIRERDPVGELAQAARLVKGRKKTVKAPQNPQLNLL